MTPVYARRDGRDRDSRRLLRDGEIVGYALRLTTGRWGLFDPESGCRLSPTTFETPRDVAEEFARRFPAKAADEKPYSTVVNEDETTPMKRHPEIEVRTLRCHDVGYLLTIVHRLVCYAGLGEPVRGVIYSGGSHEEVIKEARELLFMNGYALEMEKRYTEHGEAPVIRKLTVEERETLRQAILASSEPVEEEPEGRWQQHYGCLPGA